MHIFYHVTLNSVSPVILSTIWRHSKWPRYTSVLRQTDLEFFTFLTNRLKKKLWYFEDVVVLTLLFNVSCNIYFEPMMGINISYSAWRSLHSAINHSSKAKYDISSYIMFYNCWVIQYPHSMIKIGHIVISIYCSLSMPCLKVDLLYAHFNCNIVGESNV